MSRVCRIGKVNDIMTQGTRWLGDALAPLSEEQGDCWRSCIMPHMDRFNERKEWSFVSHVFILIKVEPVPLKILEFTVTVIPHYTGREGG